MRAAAVLGGDAGRVRAVEGGEAAQSESAGGEGRSDDAEGWMDGEQRGKTTRRD